MNMQEYAGRSRKLTTEELETFETILLLYYDFLQKQKFNKLRKIKKDQMNLPIFKYKRGIIDSINKHQVFIDISIDYFVSQELGLGMKVVICS